MSIGLPHHSIYDLPLNRVLRRNDCFTDLVRRPTQVKYEGRTYSCKKSHVGNSAIQYKNPQTGTLETGFIGNIICAPVDGALRTFIFVNPNKALPPAVENIAPFVRFHPKYQVRIYSAVQEVVPVVIESRHIITHVSTFQRPPKTYGIDVATLVVCWALNRGRR